MKKRCITNSSLSLLNNSFDKKSYRKIKNLKNFSFSFQCSDFNNLKLNNKNDKKEKNSKLNFSTIENSNKKQKDNKTKELKSVLKTSLLKIKSKKLKLIKIIENNFSNNKIRNAQEKHDLFLINISIDSQRTYENEIDILFKEKMNKLKEIDNKYNIQIYDIISFIEEKKLNNKGKEEKTDKNDDKNEVNSVSSLELLLEEITENKNEEINKVNKEYDDKLNEIKLNYTNNFIQESPSNLGNIYKNELFESFKIKIRNAIYPKIKKEVHFHIEDISKETSASTST